MKAIAIFDRGSFDILYLPKYTINNTYDEYACGLEVAETLENHIIRYGVKIGNTYNIHGVLSYKGQNRFLIIDEMNDWSFIPCELFDICDKSIDNNWCYNQYILSDNLLSVISYSRITNNYNNLTRLIEGDPATIQSLYEDFEIASEM